MFEEEDMVVGEEVADEEDVVEREEEVVDRDEELVDREEEVLDREEVVDRDEELVDREEELVERREEEVVGREEEVVGRDEELVDREEELVVEREEEVAALADSEEVADREEELVERREEEVVDREEEVVVEREEEVAALADSEEVADREEVADLEELANREELVDGEEAASADREEAADGEDLDDREEAAAADRAEEVSPDREVVDREVVVGWEGVIDRADVIFGVVPVGSIPATFYFFSISAFRQGPGRVGWWACGFPRPFPHRLPSILKTYQDRVRISSTHIPRRYTRAGNAIRNSINASLPNCTTEAVPMRSSPFRPFRVGAFRISLYFAFAWVIWSRILAEVHQSSIDSLLVGQQDAISRFPC